MISSLNNDFTKLQRKAGLGLLVYALVSICFTWMYLEYFNEKPSLKEIDNNGSSLSVVLTAVAESMSAISRSLSNWIRFMNISFLINLVFFIALRFILGFHLLLSLLLFAGVLITSFLLQNFLEFFSPWVPNEFISLSLVLWCASFLMVAAGLNVREPESSVTAH